MNDDSALILREGVKRFCEGNAAVFSERDMSSEASEFFRCHDTAHVVFGCDTSIFGEGILKIFTICGTTLGFWKHVKGYADADAFALFRQYSWRHLVGHIFKLVANVPRAFIHAKQMSKPWPWADHSLYLDRSIKEIRREFNIKVIQGAA
jgi:ubiquinone biosynthesis protein Coq4